jgi:hypothetical protein
MSKWIKQNLVLVSGIVLPVLLVAGFFVLNRMPGMLADPPANDFLLVAYRYDYRNPGAYYLSFEVRDGKLSGRAIPRGDDNRYVNRQHAGIFLYRAGDNSFDEFTFDLPEGLDDLKESVALDLAEAGELKLDKRKKSADGYQFEYLGYRGRGGLLGELFGMGRRHASNYVLKKGNVYFDLPNPTAGPNHYQNDLQFMGWVVKEGSNP